MNRLLGLRVSAILCLVSLAVPACSRQPGGPGPHPVLATGDHTLDLSHGGRARYFLLHVPPAASTGEPLPLVLALHGGGGNPDDFKPESGLDAVADREGFLVAYPAGSGVLPRTLLTWNAGTHCCGFALDQQLDDVGFLRAVVETIETRTPVDPRRVYATGHSNGAMMAYRLAAEASGLVAAIAPVGGAMMVETFAPTRPVPVLHLHSVDDPRALYAGGLGPAFPLGGEQVLHQPVLDGIGRWVARNGCPPVPTTVEERTGQAGTDNEGQSAQKLSWTPCSTGAPVVHWRLHGSGHGWPGASLSPAREMLVGPGTTLVLAAEEIWSFFEPLQLP